MSVEVGIEELVVEVSVPVIEVEVGVVNPSVEVSVVNTDVTVDITETSVDVLLSIGKEGSVILHGNGPPIDDLGLEGYYYLDEANDVFYGPKSGTSWPIALNPPGEVLAHEALPNPHPQYLSTDHLAAPNPHPQYLNQSHLTEPNPHPQYLQSVPAYTHTQAVLAKVWGIRHNLGKHPVVFVEDSGGSVIQGSVHYLDNNELTITFAYSSTGRAHCT